MKLIETHETEAVVDFAASARVSDLPFATGDRVRIFVMRENGTSRRRHTADEINQSKALRCGLRGTVIRYDNPFEPVGVEDWDALKDEPGVE